MALVALAAFGAHATAPNGLADPAIFQTAWQMHAVHTAVLMAIGTCRRSNIWLQASFWLILGGMACFCGSLYGIGINNWRGASVLAPVGGGMLLIGWFAVIIAGAFRMGYRRSDSADRRR